MQPLEKKSIGRAFTSTMSRLHRDEKNTSIHNERSELLGTKANQPTQVQSTQKRAEDEELEAIYAKTNAVQNSSVKSSQKSLQKLKETEVVALTSMDKLTEQSKQLNNVQRNMDQVHHNTDQADEQANELRRLHRFFAMKNPFRNKTKEKLKAADRDKQQYDQRVNENVALYKNQHKTRDNAEKIERQVLKADLKHQYNQRTNVPRSERERSNPDDLVEKEINDNLDEIGSVVGRLKLLAQGMNTEVSNQNEAIEHISHRTDDAHGKVSSVNRKIKKYT